MSEHKERHGLYCRFLHLTSFCTGSILSILETVRPERNCFSLLQLQPWTRPSANFTKMYASFGGGARGACASIQGLSIHEVVHPFWFRFDTLLEHSRKRFGTFLGEQDALCWHETPNSALAPNDARSRVLCSVLKGPVHIMLPCCPEDSYGHGVVYFQQTSFFP